MWCSGVVVQWALLLTPSLTRSLHCFISFYLYHSFTSSLFAVLPCIKHSLTHSLIHLRPLYGEWYFHAQLFFHSFPCNVSWMTHFLLQIFRVISVLYLCLLVSTCLCQSLSPSRVADVSVMFVQINWWKWIVILIFVILPHCLIIISCSLYGYLITLIHYLDSHDLDCHADLLLL